jgi:hypothetical protein
MNEPDEPKFLLLRTQWRPDEEHLYWFTYKLNIHPNAHHTPAYKLGRWDGVSDRQLIASIERKVTSWMIETYESTELFAIISDADTIAVIARGKNAATSFRIRFG